MAGGHFDPLPDGWGSGPEKGGTFLDIETHGLIATNATIDTITLTNMTAASGTLGTLDILGTLLLGTGGIIATATSGQRIAITEAEQDRIRFYTGDAFENISGTMRSYTSGSGTTRTLNTALFAPTTTGDASGVALVLATESFDDSTTPPSIIFQDSSGSAQTPEMKLQNGIILHLDDGTAAAPILTFNSDSNTGLYRISADTIGFTANATERMRLSTAYLFDNGTTGSFAIKHSAIGGTSTPTYTFTGDTNTGMHRPAADTVRLTANSTDYIEASASLTVALYNLSSHASHPFLRRSSSTGQVYYDSSTRDIKENIRPLQTSGIIDLLVPVSYTLVDDPAAGTLWGFIAEEVDEVLPYGTAFDADGKIINYNDRVLMAAAIQEIQDLRKRVTELESN